MNLLTVTSLSVLLAKDKDVLALIETHSLFKSSLPVVCFCQAGVTPFLLDGFFIKYSGYFRDKGLENVKELANSGNQQD